MRLKDADKLMETIKAHHYPLEVKGLNSTDYGMFTLGIQQVVDEQPTVDAVPVVRCRDCKWREAEDGFCEGRGCPIQLVPDDGFCDKGERREDEEKIKM